MHPLRLLFLGVGVLFAGIAPSPAEVGGQSIPWDVPALSRPPVFEWVPRQETRVKALRYAGLPFGGKATQVFAYYASPVTLGLVKEPPSGGFPAVVLVHGGGGTAFVKWASLWAERGYAAIAMDLGGFEPPDTAIEEETEANKDQRRPGPNPGPEESALSQFGKIAGPIEEQWPYHAVADVLLAHSLVRSFPEVDGSRTAVVGISWGGYLACIAASVDARFRAAVAVYGCGFYANGTVFGGPGGALGKMAEAARNRWVALWDPSSYLPRLRAPILLLNGTNDRYFYLEAYRRTYDCIPSEKTVRLEVNMHHSHRAGWEPGEIEVFLNGALRGGDPLPRIGEVRRNAGGQGLAAPVTSPVPLQSARLVYSTDRKPNAERQFFGLTGSISGDGVAVPALPEGTTVWYLEVVDTRGMMVTTPPELISP